MNRRKSPAYVLLPILLGVFASTLLSCRADSGAVLSFAEQYRVTAEAAEKAIAASYPYQLADIPEAQTISRVMAKIGTRSATPADLTDALKAEEARVWFLDHFDGEVQAFRTAVAESARRAEAIGNSEIRAAANGVCEELAALLRLSEALLSAQRERSGYLRQFLTSLANRERRWASLSEMSQTNNDLIQLREGLVKRMDGHRDAYRGFLDAVSKKLGISLES
jgi:hypothetical protein